MYVRTLLFLVLAAAAWGQETRSMIFGTVTDPQSAAVSGAAVTVTNTETNTSLNLTANETGYYEAALLLPGHYRVTVEAAGFKKTIRDGIDLPMSSRVQVNLRLELGPVAESVSVTAEAPLLETNSVAAGHVMDGRSVSDLPISRGNAVTMIPFTPGVQTSVQKINPSLAATAIVSGAYMPGGVGSGEYQIDGVPNHAGNRRIAYMPHTDTIQEFKVETANFDASIGHSVGVSVTMLSKTGTNQLHGVLNEQHSQQRWNATPFFIKQQYYRNIADAVAKGDMARANALSSKDKQNAGRVNNYSAAIGGPLVIPKVFNGKDKLFFFFSFNGTNDVTSESTDTINRTVPTMANREGDFSNLLRVDPVRYQIYDPLTVRPDTARPTHYIRDPIPGNILPKSRVVNPTYNAYLKFLPKPNNDPTVATKEPLINYIAAGMPWKSDYYAYSNRMDYQHSSKHRFFTRWSWSDYLEDRSDWTFEVYPGLMSQDLDRHNVAATADWVWTMSPSTLLDVAAAADEYKDGTYHRVAREFKPSSVGLPAYLDAKAGADHLLPEMQFSGYDTISKPIRAFVRYRTLAGKADLSHIRRTHSIRAGWDMRHHFRTTGLAGYSSGSFRFTNAYMRKNDDTFTPAGDLGLSWASFMMGLPSGITIDTNDTYAMYNPVYGWYVQDTWRVTPRLTLNLGFRVEYEGGPTERYNRMLRNFDFRAKLPITDAALAAYAKAPIPEIAASSFVVQGGSLYAGVGGVSRHLFNGEMPWMPRFGAAYQLDSKTVLRGGYGIYYDTMNVLYIGPNQFGFSKSTNTNVTNDFGMTWLVGNPGAGVSPMVDPFPVRADGTRFDAPVRDQLGLMAQAARSFSFYGDDTKRARQQRWRFGVQRQFGANYMIEAAYAGAYSDRIGLGVNLRPLAGQYWADGLVRNDALASNLNANVTNPFRLTNFASLQSTLPLVYQDMSTQGFYTSSTIRRNQLMRAYPQMSGLSQTMPTGKARSHELDVMFQKRFSRGFNVNVAYTRLHCENADFYANEFDAAPSWRETNLGRPHRLAATSVVELPFGKGKPLLKSGIFGWLAGGWQLGVVYEFQPGPLLDFNNLFYYGNLADINTGIRTFDRWFNTANFERNASKGPAAFHKRVFPTRVEGLRGPFHNEWDSNIQREFAIRERLRFQLRMDAINTFNRALLNPPETDPYSSNFGKITSSQVMAARYIHIQARIRF